MLFSSAGIWLQKDISPLTPLDHLLSVVLVPYWLGSFLFASLFMLCTPFVKKFTLPANICAYISAALGFTLLILASIESYNVLEIGHIGMNNIYQVSILLLSLFTVIAIWYDIKTHFKGLSVFNGFLIFFLSVFILWLYANGESAPRHIIPALRSYWLPWHVVANFIGYSAFMVAAGGAILELWRKYADKKQKATALPSQKTCRQISLSAVSFGFPIFTLATLLGSLWAYEAWGGYWSWDPKETWALIVWLTYAAYLHLSYTPYKNTILMPIWAILGFFITLFCYLGVNILLDGLHSYGALT